MRQNENRETIIGYLYGQDLTLRKVENKESKVYGQEFISGNVDIATDEGGLNVIRVRYGFVTPTTAKGNPNRTFSVLKSIMEGDQTWLKVGKDNALKVSASARLATNDYVNSQTGELVEQMINEGSFLSIINSLPDEDKRNEFTVDVLFDGYRIVEEDDKDPYLVLKGYVFNYKNELQPVKLSMRDPEGMRYFESLEPTSQNIVYTKVWGPITNVTTVTTKEQPVAWGAPKVIPTRSVSREWLIENAAAEQYVFGDESAITVDELRKALQDREVHKADVASRAAARTTTSTATQPTAFGAGAATATAQPVKKGNFSF